jgi:hypothetical protein
MASSEAKHPDCLKCEHFFVTWEAAHPRGCRAYGFKSRQLPSLVVFGQSGSPCRSFQQKPSRRPADH